ncbi:MAG: MHS family MFS transporter [Acidobacteria bacterium]|jgi:MFS family permease|nr:MHS family MFS transporter [Acidobacteriota bacterium]MBA4124310.1 MHS family MFS transporter [Acidobacteriota bacterium]
MATAARDLGGLYADSISTTKIWQVIGASSVGTMIEWYDFYIFGSLASVISPLFYPPGNDTFALIAYLATFAVGFVVRPFGALFFGRIGDIVGRKYAFLVTLMIMGGATAIIGFLPTYAQIGIAAPIILLLIRVLQGLALGGEYGGAAVYVAEHVPDNKRGFYTSFIQITATLGLFLSLAVILAVQNTMSADQFAGKTEGFAGWRIPFLISIFLVAISLYIRLRMKESPIFQHVKSAGMTSASPLVEAFTKWENLKIVLISLFGATAGQGVVWYTGQFYALFYLQSILNVNATSSNYIVAIALLLGMPLFVVFGALSDRIGRKWIIMAGLLLAVITYIPIYKAMTSVAGSNVVTAASEANKVTGAIKLIPKSMDASGALIDAPKVLPYTSFGDLISNSTAWMLILLIFIQVIWVTMVYGPIAAYLVEAFPAKIRYTALSLPYHIGNGVFGGLLPLIGLSVIAQTGNIYAGLYYPMIVASITFIVGSLLLRESRDVKIWEEVGMTPEQTRPTREAGEAADDI